MNSSVKKTISLILAVIIASSAMMTASAAENKNRNKPVINVDGIATRDIYQNRGAADEKMLFPPQMEDVTAILKNLILPIVRFAFDKNWDAFGDKVIGAANGIFAPLACNPDGTSQTDVSVDETFYFPPNYDFNRHLYFSYDWRLDPMENSKKLNDYIKFLQDETGCSQVDLIPNSMGCTIVMAYLEQFGTDDVNAIVLRSSAFQGVSLVGELFNKKLQINKRAVIGYINGFLKQDSQSKNIGLLITVLDKVGVVDLLLKFVDKVLFQLTDRVYDESLIETFGYMPGIWSLVPDEYYESAKATMLNTQTNAALIERIDYYHYNVQNKVKDILQSAMDHGVKVAVISNYNLYGCPLTTSPDAQTDYLIDTVYTSGGAVCAPLKSTLSPDYKQAVNCGHNHISADNIIDASTCMFPEYTWFVKGMIHTEFNDDYYDLVDWILAAETQPDIFGNPRFPQFLQLNKADNTLSPVLN